MVIQKSFKFRIYPIRKQEKRLEICLDQACFLYNQLLDIHQQVYLGTKETLSQFDMNNLLNDFETLNLHSQIKQNIPKRVSDAFKHFFQFHQFHLDKHTSCFNVAELTYIKDAVNKFFFEKAIIDRFTSKGSYLFFRNPIVFEHL